MGKLLMFNMVSLDGYFVDKSGDMRWARRDDQEWKDFAAGNAKGGGTLVFGRVTYDMMASFWPTPMAAQSNPGVAEGMNRCEKIVFSRTMEKASWNNTKLVKGGLVAEMEKLKKEPGKDMAILGSGSIVAQLAEAGLIDEYQFVMIPVVLGGGRTLFEGVKKRLSLKLIKTRAFNNGNVLLCYEPAM